MAQSYTTVLPSWTWGFGSSDFKQECWWVQDGEWCGSPMVPSPTYMGWYCNRGHKTSERDIAGRTIKKERTEK